AIRMLRQRLSSPFIQEFEMPGEELKRKQKIMNTVDVKMLFHTHYPGQKLLLARYANGWVLVDCFLFHHIKPKKKAKNKTNAGNSETQNI
ncbi:hypothetical protein G3W04_27055, partial [Klebsiella pneumoniae]|nr:hypothetical protein [Klebsiella pneumoniae]